MSTFLTPLRMPRTEAALRDAAQGSPEARWVAAIALGRESGPKQKEAIHALETLLIDSLEEIRAQALEGIAEQKLSGAPVSENVSLKMLKDSAPCVRCTAVETAATLLVDPVSAVAPLLKDVDPSVRAAAATAIGELKAFGSADLVAELLEDSDEFVKERAAMALSALDDPRCESMLVALLDGETSAACDAAFALGELSRAASVPALRKTANRRFAHIGLRAAAAAAMARCSAPEGRDILVAMLESRSHLKRMTALGAIARLPVAGMAFAVGKLLESGRAVQISSAIQTLAAIAEADRDRALSELRNHAGRVGEEFEEELNEAIESLCST